MWVEAGFKDYRLSGATDWITAATELILGLFQ